MGTISKLSLLFVAGQLFCYLEVRSSCVLMSFEFAASQKVPSWLCVLLTNSWNAKVMNSKKNNDFGMMWRKLKSANTLFVPCEV